MDEITKSNLTHISGRIAGHKHVKENHTYTNRWRSILKEIGK